jgi:hypothetical protein
MAHRTVWRLSRASFGLLAFLGCVVVWQWLEPSTSPSGPQTMREVIAIVQKLGLHYRSDRSDSLIDYRLVVSESPLTLERVNVVAIFRPPDHPDWTGTVAVYRKGHGIVMDVLPESDTLVAWGEFLLYGDRSLIKRLTQ